MPVLPQPPLNPAPPASAPATPAIPVLPKVESPIVPAREPASAAPVQPGVVPEVPSPPPPPPRPVVSIRRSRGAAPSPVEITTQSSAGSGWTPPDKIATPLLSLEKRGPADVQMGQPVRFEIVVRNLGAVPATQVRIEDTLPERVRFLGAAPQPILEAGRVVWNLPQVLPNQEQKVFLELQAMAAGELTTQTSVSHAVESRSRVKPAIVGLSVNAPERAAVGQPVIFDVQLANTAVEPIAGLILHAEMSGGLSHPEGRSIESNQAIALPAHGSKSLTLTTTAIQPGRQFLDVTISAAGGQQAVGHAEVFVGEQSLVIHVPPMTRILPGRFSDLAIHVGNYDAKPARKVTVTSKLPPGIDFSAASDKGTHKASSHTVQWVIDSLPSGQSRTLVLKVKGKAPGQFVQVISAKAADGQKAGAEGMILVDGTAQLSLAASVKDNLLEVGRETVFEIRLSNDGSSPDTNIRLEAQLPDGLVPRFIKGATYRMQGRVIVFDPIARLEPGKQAVIQIGVLATAAGERPLRVQVASQQLATPVMREARTRVYSDR